MSDNPQWEIIQGDALKVLSGFAPGTFDAVITDPPYASGGRTQAEKNKSTAKKYSNMGDHAPPPFDGDAKDQRSWTRWAAEWLYDARKICKPGAPVCMFIDWRQLPAMTDAVQAAGWTWRGVVVWHKRTGRPLRGEFRREAEFVIFASKGRLGYRGPRCLPGLYAHTVDHKKKNHLTSKPVELLRELMEVVPEGGTVLDPFIGGGSTAEAARDTGRTCIGVELSPDYAAITAQRVAS